HWRRIRYSCRHRACDNSRSESSSLHDGRSAGDLQSLQPGASSAETSSKQWPHRPRSRRREWPDRRVDRTWWDCGDGGVPIAWWSQGHATCSLSTGDVCNLRDERYFVCRRGGVYVPDAPTFCTNPSHPGCRHLVWLRPVRKTE